jgi:streptogramin lyase
LDHVAQRGSRRKIPRFDPTSKKWTIYQLPVVGAECRNIYVDEYGDPGEVWMASWRTAKAIRMQLRTEQQLAALGNKK